MPEYYEIVIEGRLNPGWSQWFAGLALENIDGEKTLLAGQLSDQAALHGLIERIRDLNLTLVSVNRLNPDHQYLDKEEEGGS